MSDPPSLEWRLAMEARRLVGTMTFPVLILVAWLWLSGGQFAGVMPHAQRDAQPAVRVAAVQDVQHVNVALTFERSRDELRLILMRALPRLVYPPEQSAGRSAPAYAPDATARLTSSP
jgi:hypothetical protein